MQGEMIGKRFDFAHDTRKVIYAHPGLGSCAWLAEAAREITAIGDLDINFLEFFRNCPNAMLGS